MSSITSGGNTNSNIARTSIHQGYNLLLSERECSNIGCLPISVYVNKDNLANAIKDLSRSFDIRIE